MPTTVLFAKKVTIPSRKADVIQSVNMASAFSLAGAEVLFYPGLHGGENTLTALLEEAAIPPEHARRWHSLPAASRGIYGLLFRLRVAAAYMSAKRCLAYARDIMEASFLSRLRSVVKGERKLLFEMHNVLHLLHQDQAEKYNWRKTFRKEQAIFRSVDGLVATNAALVDAAKELFGYAGPVLVEWNGYNPALFYPLPLFSEAAPWPDAEAPVELIYIGSFIPGKGVEELLDALAMLPPRFRLRVIGSGSPEAVSSVQKKVLSIPQGAQRIRLLGNIPQTQLREACMGAHIAVLPQQEGTFFSPIKLNEYMALGLPTVCAPLKIFAQQAHLMHRAKDNTPEFFAAAIAELAAQPGLARELRAGGIAASARHTWQARAERILDFAAGLPGKGAS